MQVLPSPPLVVTSMSEGGEIHDNSLAMAGPGSTPVSAPSASVIPPETLPLPEMPSAQIPVSTQPGRYGGVGLPASRPNQTAPLRVGLEMPAGAGSGGKTEPQQDGGSFTTGNQPGGNQGAGNPGAGDSGDGALWQATPSFRPPAWGSQSVNS